MALTDSADSAPSGTRRWSPDDVPRRVRMVTVLAIVLVTLGYVWLDGARTGFISCWRDCGEVFAALQYVDNYRVYGLRYGLVEDTATSPDPAAHPYLYSHNVNVGGLAYTLLEVIGVRPFWAKQLLTILGFGAGLLYVYRGTAYLSGSWLAGLATLVFFVTDVVQVLPFGLNPLRGWHWLALFGLLFHIARMARWPGPTRWADLNGAGISAVLAFAIGYDFWVICGFLAVATAVLCQPRPRSLRRLVWQLALVSLFFIVPFVARQVQIMMVLGPEFWAADVIYSAVIKVSVLSQLVALPSQADLDAIYRAAGVVRAPAKPTESWASIMGTLREMVYHLLAPDVGLIALTLAVVAAVIAPIAALAAVALSRRRLVSLLRRLGVRGRARRELLGACVLVTVVAFAVVAGLAFFAPLSLHIYLKHRFPLVAAPILLVKGVLLAALLNWHFRTRLRRPRLGWLAVAAALFLIVDHGIVQAQAARAGEAMTLAWVGDVSARRDASFAVSYVPNVVTPYTENWAVGVALGHERLAAERIRDGRMPFELSEYLLFGMRDAEARAEMYRRPDFWLYFPTEQLAPFDSPAPSCHQDYLLGAAMRLRHGADPSPRLRNDFWVQRAAVRPGDVLRIGGQIAGFGQTMFRAELLMDGQPVGALNFDCMRARFLGEYRVPPELAPGEYRFAARLIAPSDRIHPMGEAVVQIDPAAPAAAPFLAGAQPPQPSPAELEAMLPGVPVVARGDGYVIFDLRGVYPTLR